MRGPTRISRGSAAVSATSRVRALKAFREDALAGEFPGEAETVGMDPREMEGFLDRLEREGS